MTTVYLQVEQLKEVLQKLIVWIGMTTSTGFKSCNGHTLQKLIVWIGMTTSMCDNHPVTSRVVEAYRLDRYDNTR